MQRTMRIVVALTADTELGGYTAEAVGLGVFSQGETVEEATANLSEAVALYYEDEPAEDLPSDHQVLMTSVDVRLSA